MRLLAGALASAALMWAAFPPLDLGVLIFVAPAPLLWALRRADSPQEAAALGFIFGFALWGGMLWWIFILGAVAWFPLTIALALYATLYALLLYVVREWSPFSWWVVAVGGWAAWEFARARWPLGGFPWGSAGYPVGTVPGMRGSAQWIGASGWGVVVVAFAAGLVLAREEEGDRRWLELSVFGIIVLTIAGWVFSPDAGGAAVRAAIVQGNSPCPRVHCEDEKLIIYTSHLGLTGTIDEGEVDLVVWGEDSFGGSVNPTFDGEVRRQMGGEAARIGAYVIAGGTRPFIPGEFDNYNVLFAPDGEVAGEYLKRHPVPFGEYVPLRDLLDFIPQLDEVPNDMRRGEEPVVFPISVGGGEGTFGSVISFEGAFARTMRSEVNAGARMMVVATNEGSYGRGPASDQLIGMVRMTAASLGVDVVHAAVTGRSTFISADGSVGEKTDLFTEDVLFGTVNMQERRRTLYAVAGDWLQVGAVSFAAILLAAYRRPHRDFKIKPERRR